MDVVAAFLGILTTLAGLAALLGRKYFEKEMELEKFRRDHVQGALSQLDATVQDHKKAIRAHTDSIEKLNSTIMRSDKDLRELSHSVKEYAESHDARIIAFEQKVLRLSEDLIIVKGTKRESR